MRPGRRLWRGGGRTEVFLPCRLHLWGEGADMKRLHVTGYLPGACPGNSKLAIDIAFLREVEIAVKSGSVS